MNNTHSFHIPVMGIGFTIDTPIKVAQYGIDSVISIVDDVLLEKLRKKISSNNSLPYQEISEKNEDFRAKRITAYLNLLHDLVHKQYENIQQNGLTEKHLDLLPDHSKIKADFKRLTQKFPNKSESIEWLKRNFSMGSIDVNIMTKVDRETYTKKEKQATEYNEAHSALRGYANSKLSSSVIFSAGMNPRLYSYAENFEDFYPNQKGELKKKIILKVSDYRSAIIQGKFLAKKGLWVSEYRIESGLNCGGHAFATQGFLLGPILEEFKSQRQELIESTHEIYIKALTDKKRTIPTKPLELKITAQGGVGTAEEHQFLLDHYNIDSVGWGSPFLLVPEATTVDDITLQKLADAKEKDLYLSNVSPLGVPFNNLRDSTKATEKAELLKKGKVGSPCVRKFLALNTEFSSSGDCTASTKYQLLKIKELDALGLPQEEHQAKLNEITDKECLCTGLSSPALTQNKLDTKLEGKAVSVCPGPNMAYFSSKMSLKEITGHIYGNNNVLQQVNRPNMFLKELSIYVDYLKKEVSKSKKTASKKQKIYLSKFANNLTSGIDYYNNLFSQINTKLNEIEPNITQYLVHKKQDLKSIIHEIETVKI